MFKSTLIARNEMVRVLLALPSLQSAGSIEVLSSEIKESERYELETAFVFDSKRAPIYPLNDARTKFAGPEIRKAEDPFPVTSTPGLALPI